jgi:hypothetical protein
MQKVQREGKRKNGAQFAWDEDRITGLNSDTDPELPWREVYANYGTEMLKLGNQFANLAMPDQKKKKALDTGSFSILHSGEMYRIIIKNK